MIIPGAVITPLAFKSDLFTKKRKRGAILPAEDRTDTELRFLDRRRRAI